MKINPTQFSVSSIKGLLVLSAFMVILFFSSEKDLYAQKKIRFSISVDPLLSWFSHDNPVVDSKGTNIDLKYGLTMDSFFDENYAISSGIFMTGLRGNLTYNDTVFLGSAYDTATVLPGMPVGYSINYLTIPFGLKLKTIKIGYKTFYFDFGVNAMIRVKSKVNSSAAGLNKYPVRGEINLFNMSYYVGGGMEYSLGGNTALTGGIYYSGTFLDLTSDALNKPPGRTFARMLSIKLGVLF